jgi:hypothetical protein
MFRRTINVACKLSVSASSATFNFSIKVPKPIAFFMRYVFSLFIFLLYSNIITSKNSSKLLGNNGIVYSSLCKLLRAKRLVKDQNSYRP